MEMVATAKGMLMTQRRLPKPIGGLSPAQLAWCRSKWPWFEHNRVVRLERLADVRPAGERVAV
jgi:hypothetical protein